MSLLLPPSTSTSHAAYCDSRPSSHEEQLPTRSTKKPVKPMLYLKAPHLNIASTHQSTTSLRLDDESTNSPVESMSPVVFRREDDDDWSDSYLSRGSDSVFSCSSRQASAWYHHPVTSYNFLSPQRVPTPDPYSPFSQRPVPKRTSSLRSFRQAHSAPMSRAASPSPSESTANDDRCSDRMVFAPRDPSEPDYGSSPSQNARSPTPSSSSSLSISPIWHSWKSSRSTRSHSEMSSIKSMSSLRSEESRDPSTPRPSMPKTNIRVPNEDMLAIYSSSMMAGSMAMSAFATAAPTPLVMPKRSKPKAKQRSLSSASTASEESTSEKPAKTPTFKRIRQIVTRKSISSLDVVLNSTAKADTSHPSTNSTSTLVSNSAVTSPARSRKSSLNVDNFTDHPPVITITPSDTLDDDADEQGFSAHCNIDGVWKKQDINDVIPMLRSMKFGGKY
ncbi:hypothetical protein BC629DRAFT_1594875 [Irpex lacteus]|nr:hypothetical protein BC629DRAFT_1594875 [Irpex lacteus]